MAELGQQTVDFSALVSRAAEESYVTLKELVEKCKSSDLSDSEKKIGILKYVVKTQQRMLRLNVLSKWCQQVPLIQYCQQLASTLSSHDTCFTQAADSLFFMHEGLQQARAPIYDVPSAVEVLLTGSYGRLPKCIGDLGLQSSLNDDQQKPALKKLDALVRSKLLEVSLPKDITEVKVSDGTVLLRVDGEFKVLVTLGYRGHLSMWRILHMELLVGERSGPMKLDDFRRHALGDDLERRMAAADNPFMTLYSILHELCVALVMDTVIRQVQTLRQGRWKDAIRFELITDGSTGQGSSAGSTQTSQDGESESASLRTPGLKILYWLDLDKNIGTSEIGTCPFIKIEPGPDLQIKCLHSTFVIDPLTGKEAEFSLDQSCIDIEKLLLRVICCNRYTRLLEIFKEVEKNGQICRVPGDVQLQCHVEEVLADSRKKDNKFDSREYQGQEVLRVRAFGSSFFTLAINIRNGHFILHSSKNVISSSVVVECEEALNQGSMSAAEAFNSLRSKSILHLFACIGRFLGLEVFEHGSASVKVPKSISCGTNFLLMGFPECGSSYFLLMELDKDFKPVFKLLESQSDSPAKAQPLADLSNMVRVKTIDVGRMQICEDKLNLSLLNSKKLLSILPSDGRSHQSSENSLLADFSLEGSIVASSAPSAFSSIVDEMFELEKGSSVPSFSGQLPPSTFGAPPASHFGSGVANYQNLKVGTLSPKWDRGAGNYSSSIYKGVIQSGSAARLLSPAQRVSASSGKASGPRNSAVGTLPAQAIDSATCTKSEQDAASRYNILPRKRTLSDLLDSLPSLKAMQSNEGSYKRRKLVESAGTHLSKSPMLISSDISGKTEEYSYGSLIAEANKGNAPSSIYVSALLHVVRHCSLCIKHARLTSQMEELDIPYVEEVGLRSASSNLWFRVPFARDDGWQHICLRLGRPGSMYWDVKINDQHFQDLWELQKGSNSTPWGSGVRIANTSDADSHIRYDCEGVVLSYYSVNADSIKKLVADIQRLSNARTFAFGMRKLLGARADEKFEENNVNSESKTSVAIKGSADATDRISEQMRKQFRIEAVGLMSLWFSFGSGVLARFVVEWESGKEGCTMHVSPDQLWPHTKFLEDFINGAEVASLLDCIRLTAGPLHALAAATRPARAAPVSGVPGVTAPISSVAKQASYVPSLPSNVNSSINQPASGPGVNPVSATVGTLGTHSHPSAA
ncbi:Mediator of RNA polymerase II transcription subunit 14, partial [Capsicum annuum]